MTSEAKYAIKSYSVEYALRVLNQKLQCFQRHQNGEIRIDKMGILIQFFQSSKN